VTAAARIADGLVETAAVPGIAIVACDRAGVVFEHYAGHADREGRAPVTAETRFPLASLTKPLVAVAALVAVEEGIIGLDDPLAAVLPGAAPQVTLRGALAHYSGLPEGSGAGSFGVPPGAGWAEIRAAAIAIPPEAPAVTRRIYSNVGYALAGAALEAAGGMGIETYVDAAVCRPLGLAGTSLGLPAGTEAAWVRDAGLWMSGVPLFNSEWFRREPLPQSGGWSTARDYARILQLVLAGGERLLAPETCAELLTNQGGALEGGVGSFMTWPRADWALGFELRDAKQRHWTGSALSSAAATHFGASGTLCFADPGHGRAAAVLVNRGTYSGWMLRPGAWPDLVAALLEVD
jgi:CubicO group peptidase (beta-lactamase class C family)